MALEQSDDKPVELDPDTLSEVARIMRETIGTEIPVGPAQTGSFNATLTWAMWLDKKAAERRAAL